VEPASIEELENIRRMAERGRDVACYNQNSTMVDMFQHILDLVGVIKSYEDVQSSITVKG